jgi:hypothetical protein
MLCMAGEAETTCDLELTRIVHHPDPEIATACHQRRELARLSLQLVSAREELLRTSTLLSTLSGETADVKQLLHSMALLLDDRCWDADMREPHSEDGGQNAAAATVSNVGKELWLPQI